MNCSVRHFQQLQAPTVLVDGMFPAERHRWIPESALQIPAGMSASYPPQVVARTVTANNGVFGETRRFSVFCKNSGNCLASTRQSVFAASGSVLASGCVRVHSIPGFTGPHLPENYARPGARLLPPTPRQRRCSRRESAKSAAETRVVSKSAEDYSSFVLRRRKDDCR